MHLVHHGARGLIFSVSVFMTMANVLNEATKTKRPRMSVAVDNRNLRLFMLSRAKVSHCESGA
jgi:hypothetical protein